MSADPKVIREFLKRKPPAVLNLTDPAWERYVQQEMLLTISGANYSLLARDSHFCFPSNDEPEDA